MISQSLVTPYFASICKFSYVCGASFDSSISVLSSSSCVLGIETVNGIGEIFAVEGRVPNGRDIAAMLTPVYYQVPEYRLVMMKAEFPLPSYPSCDKCGGASDYVIGWIFRVADLPLRTFSVIFQEKKAAHKLKVSPAFPRRD